jgi:Holliday junction resolvase-like predicted endonuclease
MQQRNNDIGLRTRDRPWRARARAAGQVTLRSAVATITDALMRACVRVRVRARVLMRVLMRVLTRVRLEPILTRMRARIQRTTPTPIGEPTRASSPHVAAIAQPSVQTTPQPRVRATAQPRVEPTPQPRIRPNARAASDAPARAHLRIIRDHAARDGPLLALLYIARVVGGAVDGIARRLGLRHAPRDAGERAAERFLRALGYRRIARNWRSPRDPRDEADLAMLAPDGETLVLVEVKRARGPWDALDRVDRRKREVLWRLLRDAADPSCPLTAASGAERVRVDLVGVRGEGVGASAVRHVVGLFEVRITGGARPVRHGRGPPRQRQ